MPLINDSEGVDLEEPKAPKVEGKGYERLYARETAEPVFVYWKETWVVEPK